MSTFLFDDIVFGPVKSRRLGISLGINLLPTTHKLCNFNCIYCECGLNTPPPAGATKRLPTSTELKEALENRLIDMYNANEPLDSITYAGNGEPTLHPEFAQIVDDSIELRNKYYPSAVISVLSNATLVGNDQIRTALDKVDRNILKIDSAFEETIRVLNCPNGEYQLERIIQDLGKFKHAPIIQTMFIRGEYKGTAFDNTTDTEVEAWLEVLKRIHPSEVMIYSIARDTPIDSLEQIGMEELQRIGKRVNNLGIKVQVTP